MRFPRGEFDLEALVGGCVNCEQRLQGFSPSAWFSAAHFHAFYQGHEALIAIETLEVIAGELPRRAVELVFDWAELHRRELMENWQKAQDHLLLDRIEPLE